MWITSKKSCLNAQQALMMFHKIPIDMSQAKFMLRVWLLNSYPWMVLFNPKLILKIRNVHVFRKLSVKKLENRENLKNLKKMENLKNLQKNSNEISAVAFFQRKKIIYRDISRWCGKKATESFVFIPFQVKVNVIHSILIENATWKSISKFIEFK